ncbi:hypothetical protein Q4E93_14395 [Flavitalea sp. BT771]|uniref:hypothetical protein n=1 Tax=Flavitalea sp. BT771 TaxID=3063329 RepID=UPI0026E19A63|nr:hypothetical protein [Flavitalea sp. BT771]MDO6431791.1 hypothetical protein [Flavitalea sp. BT771]MDV6220699.1 hypothetical protein [Flavitalea sp. BT771]
MKNSADKFTASVSDLGRHPLDSRPTVSSLENAEGAITLIDGNNFGIRQKGDGAVLLLPVNLPAQLRKAGTRVIFSGSIKQPNPEEMWAGQPFLLTDIKEV